MVETDLLRLAFDELPEPLLVIDTQFRVALANRAVRDLFDSPAEPDLTCCAALHGRLHPCDPSQTSCPLRAAAESGAAVRVEHRHRLPGGEERSVEIAAIPLRGAAGELAGILEVVHDLSEKAVLEQAAKRARNEWQATADAVPESIYLTDHGGTILRCNRSARDFLGRDYPEIVGQDIHRILRRGAPGAVLTEEPDREIQWESPRVLLHLSRYPVHLGERVTGTVWVLRDVTALRRLEAIAASVDMMNNLGHVFSAVRHEIGNPVNAIKTALTVLQDGFHSFSEEKKKAYVQRCLDDVGRIQTLLDHLRTFNMFEAVSPRPLEILGFVAGLEGRVREAVESHHVDFAAAIPRVGEVWVWADGRALQQVVLALLSNAIDAVGGRSRGRIGLAVQVEAAHVTLAVSDDGAGIPEEDRELVFLPLFTTKQKGTGLGLPIARNMLARMQGTITLTANAGGGARAEVLLTRCSRKASEPPVA